MVSNINWRCTLVLSYNSVPHFPPQLQIDEGKQLAVTSGRQKQTKTLNDSKLLHNIMDLVSGAV
eukprot:1159771-Amphidinium_carterae.1